MKTFSSFLKKLPASRRARIEANAQRAITAIRLQQVREELGVTQEELVGGDIKGPRHLIFDAHPIVRQSRS